MEQDYFKAQKILTFHININSQLNNKNLKIFEGKSTNETYGSNE
jgi:hypothetical protein